MPSEPPILRQNATTVTFTAFTGINTHVAAHENEHVLERKAYRREIFKSVLSALDPRRLSNSVINAHQQSAPPTILRVQSLNSRSVAESV